MVLNDSMERLFAHAVCLYHSVQVREPSPIDAFVTYICAYACTWRTNVDTHTHTHAFSLSLPRSRSLSLALSLSLARLLSVSLALAHTCWRLRAMGAGG